MELLFVALGGLILGLIAYYALPRRNLTGAALLPAFGAIVAALLWVALTWLGLKYDAPVIWLITLPVTAAATVAVALLLGRSRQRRDADLFQQISSGRTPIRR